MNTGLGEGGTGWYSVVLGGTGSEQSGTGCQHDELSENIYGLHGLNNQIIEYLKMEKVITDKQTNRKTEFPLVDSTPSVKGVE